MEEEEKRLASVKNSLEQRRQQLKNNIQKFDGYSFVRAGKAYKVKDGMLERPGKSPQEIAFIACFNRSGFDACHSDPEGATTVLMDTDPDTCPVPILFNTGYWTEPEVDAYLFVQLKGGRISLRPIEAVGSASQIEAVRSTNNIETLKKNWEAKKKEAIKILESKHLKTYKRVKKKITEMLGGPSLTITIRALDLLYREGPWNDPESKDSWPEDRSGVIQEYLDAGNEYRLFTSE
ncbi:MAG TPA: hypothetical protein ENF20_09135 [Candidatus Marinimicrobia bacterium]|nr:hypothetical protein [Candidatus Neomarinimicrobiota bacterium]